MDYDIRALSIDDTITLLNFYYDYPKSKSYAVEVKESLQKGRFDYYLDGKQYTFYSENAVKILKI